MGAAIALWGVGVGLIAVPIAVGCGGRSDLRVFGADGGVLAPEATENVFCSSTLGPVSSCPPGPDAGFVAYCGSPLPVCAKSALGVWECEPKPGDDPTFAAPLHDYVCNAKQPFSGFCNCQPCTVCASGP